MDYLLMYEAKSDISHGISFERRNGRASALYSKTASINTEMSELRYYEKDCIVFKNQISCIKMN